MPPHITVPKLACYLVAGVVVVAACVAGGIVAYRNLAPKPGSFTSNVATSPDRSVANSRVVTRVTTEWTPRMTPRWRRARTEEQGPESTVEWGAEAASNGSGDWGSGDDGEEVDDWLDW